MNHFTPTEQFVPSASADRWQEGAYVTAHVTCDLMDGPFCLCQFEAYVTIYRNFTGEIEIGEVEVEAWRDGVTCRRTVEEAPRTWALSTGHFFHSAVMDEIEKPAVAHRLDEELARVEADWGVE